MIAPTTTSVLASSFTFNYLRLGAMSTSAKLTDAGKIGKSHLSLSTAVAAAKLLSAGAAPGVAVLAKAGFFELHHAAMNVTHGKTFRGDLSDWNYSTKVAPATDADLTSEFGSGFGQRSTIAANVAAFVDGTAVLIPDHHEGEFANVTTSVA